VFFKLWGNFKKVTALSVLHEWEVLDHLPHIPDLAPIDFYLFGLLKEHLICKWFATNGDMQHAAISWLNVVDVDFSHTGIGAFVSVWDRYLNMFDDYVEMWYVPKPCYVFRIAGAPWECLVPCYF
jgi:hypothetical protein